eukprot:m.498096 g.498096  ORF g.498096 m.498096 type:complete len:64 (-) comp21821_c0_seq8:2672-2863(-)
MYHGSLQKVIEEDAQNGGRPPTTLATMEYYETSEDARMRCEPDDCIRTTCFTRGQTLTLCSAL